MQIKGVNGTTYLKAKPSLDLNHIVLPAHTHTTHTHTTGSSSLSAETAGQHAPQREPGVAAASTSKAGAASMKKKKRHSNDKAG